MTITPKFNLDDFTSEGDEIIQAIPVCIPQSTFRIHPHKSHRRANVILKRYEDQWYLINPAIASGLRVGKLWKASIYEGVRTNGESFILPLTEPAIGRENRYDSLIEAIKEAQRQWITVESDAPQDSWNWKPQNNKKNQSIEPAWFDGDFSTLAELAFRSRIIRTRDDAESIFQKTLRREVFEE